MDLDLDNWSLVGLWAVEETRVDVQCVISLYLTGPEDSTRFQRLEDHETIRQGSLGALYFFKTSTHYTTTSTWK